jgi:hypothetical protein
MHHSEIVKMWLGSHPEIVQRPDHNLSHTIKAEFKWRKNESDRDRKKKSKNLW